MSYDAIIIGGGHNGLVAAVKLAQRRRRVVVVEKRSSLGGLIGPYEFHPGYISNGILHDTSCVPDKVVNNLKLGSFGLDYVQGRPPVTLVSDTNETITISGDDHQTAQSIARLSENDAEAYLLYRRFIRKITPFVQSLLYEAQPNLADPGFSETWKLLKKGISLKRLGKKVMNELLKVGPMCVADLLNEYFETDFLKAGLSLPAISGSFAGPWSSYTTLNLLLYECSSQGTIARGTNQLAQSLEKAAEKNGVELKCDAEVKRIRLDGQGCVQGVRLGDGSELTAPLVVTSCSPKETFLNLIAGNEIGHTLAAQITHLRSRGIVGKITLALDKEIEWKHETLNSTRHFRISYGLDDLEKAFDSIKYNEFSKVPALDIFIPPNSNSELAPDGHQIVSIIAHFAPYQLKTGWSDETREELFQKVIACLKMHTSGLEDSIVGREILTPADIENHFNIPGGNIFHIEHAVDQLIGRPVPRCAQYKTPVPGLYLCGSGSHPGGGVTGMPGFLAAEAILAES